MCGCIGGCSCSSNSSVLPIGPSGTSGAAGATGAQGIYGGFSGEWVYDTSTSSGPGSTLLRLNNATFASVTSIYVSDTGTGSVDYDAFLDSLSNNTEFGYIRIFKKSDSTKFWMGSITAVTDNGTDHTLVVTYITSNSTFAASDALVLTFSPSGAGSSTILYNNTTPFSTTSGSPASLMTYAIPANTLKTNDDVIEVISTLDTDETTEVKRVVFLLNGTAAIIKVPTFRLSAGEKSMFIRAIITRQSATTVFVTYEVTTTDASYNDSAGYKFFESGIVVSDLSLNTLTVLLTGQNIDATPVEYIRANQLMVKYFNK